MSKVFSELVLKMDFYITFNYNKKNMYCLKVALFQNIKALFANKPLLLVANKVDIKKISELSPEKRVKHLLFLLEKSHRIL